MDFHGPFYAPFGALVVPFLRVYSLAMPTELSEQMALCRHLAVAGVIYCSVPNGGKRNGRTATMLAMSGVQAGVPDLLIFDPPPCGGYVGVALELKRRKGGRVTPRQKRWLRLLADRKWLAVVAKGSHDALEQLREAGYAV